MSDNSNAEPFSFNNFYPAFGSLPKESWQPKRVIPSKSYAQVAPSVSPKSGELKLDHKANNTVVYKRINPLTVRLSERERSIILTKAFTVGCSVNSYVKAAALGSDYKPPINPELLKALLAANRELTMQGNNINQIAKHMNSGQVAPTEGEGLLSIIARSMLRTHKMIRAALTQGRNYEDGEA